MEKDHAKNKYTVIGFFCVLGAWLIILISIFSARPIRILFGVRFLETEYLLIPMLLITGILCVVGLIFAIIGLVQIKRGQGEGKLLAFLAIFVNPIYSVLLLPLLKT